MRALRIITAAVLIAGVVYVSFDFWAPAPAKFLIRTDPLESADLIVVLAGDGRGGRVAEGVRLLETGMAPGMIVNGSASLFQARECDLGRAYAIELGADPAVVEPLCMDADSTQDEAQIVDRELRRRSVSRAIVVTSDFHTGRSRRIFHNSTSGEVSYAFTASPTPDFNPDHWWQSRRGREIVVIEWAKTVNTWLERPD